MTNKSHPQKADIDDIKSFHDTFDTLAPAILGGFEGRYDGFRIDSLAVKHSDHGGVRLTLRATRYDAAGTPVGIIAFSEGSDIGTVLANADFAMLSDKLEWRIDQYAKTNLVSGINFGKPGKRK